MQNRLMIGALVMVVALASAASASGKGFEPVRVVTASGKVGWMRGATARAFWSDMFKWHAGSCACMSADAAARFENQFTGKARWKFHLDGAWPTGTMLIQSGHSAPSLYYPASRTTPPYIVVPAGNAKHHLSWDSWLVVTPRMQKLITSALKEGTVSTHAGSASFPTGWVVAAGLAAALLAAFILSAWRRRRLPFRLRALRGHS